MEGETNNCGEITCWAAHRLERDLREAKAVEEMSPRELLESHNRVWDAVYSRLFGSVE